MKRSIDVEDRTISLPGDGRVLGFAQYGDAGGAPVVLFHGTPGSRLIGRVCDDWARDAGCRVIALDRPGLGLSSFQEGRTVRDHVSDVVAVCDEVGVERFGVLGVSGGTPYVFACAADLPHRVTAGAVVSGFYGLDVPVDVQDFSDEQRQYWEGVRADPEVGRPNFEAAPAMLQSLPPAELMQQMLASSPEWVRRLVTDEPEIAEGYVAHLLEGLRPGSDGAVHDLRMNVEPWGIDLSAIPVEIRLWHGGLDPVPRAHVDAIAGALRRCEVSWHADLGHVDCCFLMPQIFGWLATTHSV